MDKIEKFQYLVQQELEARARRKAANMPLVERQLIVDEKRNQFILLSVGWHGAKYVHQCLLHVQIKGDKIWIQEDMTDPGLLEALIEKGIDASDIVLGYVSELERTSQAAVAV